MSSSSAGGSLREDLVANLLQPTQRDSYQPCPRRGIRAVEGNVKSAVPSGGHLGEAARKIKRVRVTSKGVDGGKGVGVGKGVI